MVRLPHSAHALSTTLCTWSNTNLAATVCLVIDFLSNYQLRIIGWLVVVVPLPTTLLLYPLSTTSDNCGCGRWHLYPLLSLVINFLSDWPTGSCHLVNTLASLYITLVGRTIPAPRPFQPETSQQYNHNSNAYPSFRLSVYFNCYLSCNIYLASLLG